MSLGSKSVPLPEYEKPAEGQYFAIIKGVVDLGTHSQSAWQGKIKEDSRQLNIEFELHDPVNPENLTKDGKPFPLTIFSLNMCFAPKATLTKLFKAAIGSIEFDRKDKAGEEVKLRDLIGNTISVSIVHNTSATNGKVYANIDKDSMSSLSHGSVPPVAVYETTFFSLDPEEYEPKVLSELHKISYGKIVGSPEFAKLGKSAPALNIPVEADSKY